MTVRTELFFIPLSMAQGSMRVLFAKDSALSKQWILPQAALKADTFQRGAQESILRDYLSTAPSAELDEWLRSPRYRDRIVEVFDRDLLFDGVRSVTIVRCVALPAELATHARGMWVPIQDVFGEEQSFASDSRLFLQECINLIPQWVRNSTLAFELLPAVFSIQELREMVCRLSGHEIDPGNFHRRLKRLNILSPLGTGQRIHKWEFVWDKSEVLRAEGLLPP